MIQSQDYVFRTIVQCGQSTRNYHASCVWWDTKILLHPILTPPCVMSTLWNWHQFNAYSLLLAYWLGLTLVLALALTQTIAAHSLTAFPITTFVNLLTRFIDLLNMSWWYRCSPHLRAFFVGTLLGTLFGAFLSIYWKFLLVPSLNASFIIIPRLRAFFSTFLQSTSSLMSLLNWCQSGATSSGPTSLRLVTSAPHPDWHHVSTSFYSGCHINDPLLSVEFDDYPVCRHLPWYYFIIGIILVYLSPVPSSFSFLNWYHILFDTIELNHSSLWYHYSLAPFSVPLSIDTIFGTFNSWHLPRYRYLFLIGSLLDTVYNWHLLRHHSFVGAF